LTGRTRCDISRELGNGLHFFDPDIDVGLKLVQKVSVGEEALWLYVVKGGGTLSSGCCLCW
jgi:hypothetical protein